MELQDEIDDFEGEAVERLECFINSLLVDKRFMIPVEEWEDGPVEENWSWVYTDIASRLINRMIDRLYKLAGIKFGEDAAFNMDISTSLYQEI